MNRLNMIANAASRCMTDGLPGGLPLTYNPDPNIGDLVSRPMRNQLNLLGKSVQSLRDMAENPGSVDLKALKSTFNDAVNSITETASMASGIGLVSFQTRNSSKKITDELRRQSSELFGSGEGIKDDLLSSKESVMGSMSMLESNLGNTEFEGLEEFLNIASQKCAYLDSIFKHMFEAAPASTMNRGLGMSN